MDYAVCTACPALHYLYAPDSSCLSSCPFGYYEYSTRCEACSVALHCESCDNSSSCLTCLSGYYYYEGLCLAACPALITYASPLFKTCLGCPDNCTQCTGDDSGATCTKCVNGYYMDDGACSLTCLTLGTVPFNNQCVSCSTVCLTCSLTPTNCTSCDLSSANPYLY